MDITATITSKTNKTYEEKSRESTKKKKKKNNKSKSAVNWHGK